MTRPEGEPLVLLPGMMCDGRVFAMQITALAGRHAMTVGDITGHDTTAALADAVLSRAPPAFALAGLAMGGIVAMEILARAPDRITRLALIGTDPRAETDAIKARRTPQIAAARDGRLAEVMRDELKLNYPGDGPYREAILGLCMEMALDLGAEAFVRQSVALRDRPDRRATLAAARLPTLILCGRDDAFRPVERHEAMKALMPQADLVIVEGAGHLPTLEQPDAVNAAMERWLEAG